MNHPASSLQEREQFSCSWGGGGEEGLSDPAKFPIPPQPLPPQTPLASLIPQTLSDCSNPPQTLLAPMIHPTSQKTLLSPPILPSFPSCPTTLQTLPVDTIRPPTPNPTKPSQTLPAPLIRSTPLQAPLALHKHLTSPPCSDLPYIGWPLFTQSNLHLTFPNVCTYPRCSQ